MPRLGSYDLHVIDAGRFALDGGAMFGIIPRPLWMRRVEPDDRNRIPLQMRCLLLEGNGRVILVDNGLGEKYDDKFADIYAIDQETSNLDGSLAEAGFSRDDVTDVVLTHLHFDHCGGSTVRWGDRFEAAFRNATYHVQRRHWSWAAQANLRERGSFLRENFEPIEAEGRLSLVEGDVELFENIHVFTVDGHTEAQQLVRIEGEGGVLVYAADLLPTSAHLAPVWGMGYDVRPLVTIEEKTRFLSEAADRGWRVFFEHDPNVEVAGLVRAERGVEIVDPRPLEDL